MEVRGERIMTIFLSVNDLCAYKFRICKKSIFRVDTRQVTTTYKMALKTWGMYYNTDLGHLLFYRSGGGFAGRDLINIFH